MYTYSDLNDYLHQYMKKKGHLTTDDKTGEKYHINQTFVLSTYKILFQFDNNYQLDLRNTQKQLGSQKRLPIKQNMGQFFPMSQIPLT